MLKQGAKVWVRNPYPPSADEAYRADWLPARMCGRPIWIPAEIVSLAGSPLAGLPGVAPAGAVSSVTVRTTLQPPVTLTLPPSEVGSTRRRRAAWWAAFIAAECRCVA